jgi:hypothetical protein
MTLQGGNDISGLGVCRRASGEAENHPGYNKSGSYMRQFLHGILILPDTKEKASFSSLGKELAKEFLQKK